jgi:predicted dithiol-disulfide oxidoreductase (DUF899 family)
MVASTGRVSISSRTVRLSDDDCATRRGAEERSGGAMAMNHPAIVSRAEWLSARKELLGKEKAFTRQRDALNAERRRLPMVKIDKDYVFEGPNGRATLRDLFEGRQQLIVYHFMFDPGWDAGCPSCSFLTDNIGHLSHLHARKTTLALVSRAPFGKIEAYRKRMGWTVPGTRRSAATSTTTFTSRWTRPSLRSSTTTRTRRRSCRRARAISPTVNHTA